jgi:DNA repair protein RadC
MHIREWPEHERPRERLLRLGSQSLSDAELLAVFIGCGTQGQSAVDVGRELLHQQGGLRALLDMPAADMIKLRGLGPARACALSAALELSQRHLAAQLQRGEIVSNAKAAGRYFAQRLRHLPHEEFACLFLDAQHRVIAYEVLSKGSVQSADVYPREVARRALHFNAAALMLAHNYPSGHRESSAADRAVTQTLQAALQLIEVRLLDHFIIGDGAPVSMAALGLL